MTLAGTEYDPEDYAISTDVGKFGLDQKSALEDVNLAFERADEAEFWKDITGAGVSAFSLLTPSKLPGEEWYDVEVGTKGIGGAPEWLKKLKFPGRYE